jgi:CHAT domain-containing protein
MSARFASGSGELATLVRRSQDLALRYAAVERQLTDALGARGGQRDDALLANLRRDLEENEAQLKAIEASLAQGFPKYQELASPPPLTIAAVQQLLGPNEALVAYLVSASDTLVFAVTRQKADAVLIERGADAIAGDVRRFRSGLDVEDLAKSAERGELFSLVFAHQLYQTLLGPVAGTIHDKDSLIIAPSGALTSLPFHLLLTDPPADPNAKTPAAYRDAPWLVHRHAVTVLPSVTSLRALRVAAKGARAKKPLIAFGDPVIAPAAPGGAPISTAANRGAHARGYASFWNGPRPDLDTLRKGLAPLPETAEEIRTVAKAVGEMDLSVYRIVYFATHGLVAGEVTGLAEPALVLSLPAQPSDLDDGLLTASEVAQLKLNADWVALSACNTAAGDKPSAEALSGLARAFFYAGARALLVSHWRLDSKAAVRLTTATFTALQRDPTIGRAEALRRAMSAFIADTSQPWNAYPDFWGAFSVVGEGGAERDRR